MGATVQEISAGCFQQYRTALLPVQWTDTHCADSIYQMSNVLLQYMGDAHSCIMCNCSA